MSLQGPDGRIWALRFGRRVVDNKVLLAAGGDDNTTMVWEIDLARPLSRSKGPPTWVLRSPRKKLNSKIVENRYRNREVRALDFSSFSNLLAVGLANGDVMLWDIDAGAFVQYLETSEGIDADTPATDAEANNTVWSLRFSPEPNPFDTTRTLPRFLVVGRQAAPELLVYERKAGVWELRQRISVAPAGAVLALEFSPDGRYLAVAGDNKNILIFERQDSRDQPFDPQPNGGSAGPGRQYHRDSVWSLAFSDVAPHLVSASDDRHVGNFRVSPGQQMVLRSVERIDNAPEAHGDDVLSVVHVGGTNTFFSSSWDETVRAWALGDDGRLRPCDEPDGGLDFIGMVRDCDVSPVVPVLPNQPNLKRVLACSSGLRSRMEAGPYDLTLFPLNVAPAQGRLAEGGNRPWTWRPPAPDASENPEALDAVPDSEFAGLERLVFVQAGVSTYDAEGTQNLPGVQTNCHDLRRLFADQASRWHSFSRPPLFLPASEAACAPGPTRDEVLELFRTTLSEVRSTDFVVVYFGGHGRTGLPEYPGSHYYFMTRPSNREQGRDLKDDAPLTQFGMRTRSSISLEDISLFTYHLTKRVNNGAVLLVLDTCSASRGASVTGTLTRQEFAGDLYMIAAAADSQETFDLTGTEAFSRQYAAENGIPNPLDYCYEEAPGDAASSRANTILICALKRFLEMQPPERAGKELTVEKVLQGWQQEARNLYDFLEGIGLRKGGATTRPVFLLPAKAPHEGHLRFLRIPGNPNGED